MAVSVPFSYPRSIGPSRSPPPGYRRDTGTMEGEWRHFHGKQNYLMLKQEAGLSWLMQVLVANPYSIRAWQEGWCKHALWSRSRRKKLPNLLSNKKRKFLRKIVISPEWQFWFLGRHGMAKSNCRRCNLLPLPRNTCSILFCGRFSS